MSLDVAWDSKIATSRPILGDSQLAVKISSHLVFFPFIAAFISLGIFIFIASYSAFEQSNYNAFFKEMQEVDVNVKTMLPDISQQSIDLAMSIYSIKTPAIVEHITLDDTLEDRAQTMGTIIWNSKFIKVGASAFSSWSILGSTLAHEIEVHANQSFLLISVLDCLGLVWEISINILNQLMAMNHKEKLNLLTYEQGLGSIIAERMAYDYEVAQARRFGLHSSEQQAILDTKEMFYKFDLFLEDNK